MLASVSLPAVSKAKEQARRIRCLNNVRPMALACHLYAEDNRDDIVTLYRLAKAPPGSLIQDPVSWWVDLLRPTLRGANVIA